MTPLSFQLYLYIFPAVDYLPDLSLSYITLNTFIMFICVSRSYIDISQSLVTTAGSSSLARKIYMGVSCGVPVGDNDPLIYFPEEEK